MLIINTLNRDYGKTSLHVAAVLSHSQPHTSTKSGKTPLHEAAEKQSICKEVFSTASWSGHVESIAISDCAHINLSEHIFCWFK